MKAYVILEKMSLAPDYWLGSFEGKKAHPFNAARKLGRKFQFPPQKRKLDSAVNFI